MSDSREAFEGHCARIGFVLKPDGGGDYLPGNGQELWSIWCASWQAARAGQAASEPVAEVAQVGGTPVVFWDKSLLVGTKLYTHPACVDNQAVSVPNSEYIRALQDAFDIIQADANTEQNYGSMCRIGSVLSELQSTPTKDGGWIKCSDRLPAEYDGDFEGLVWVNDRDMTLPKCAQSRVHWSRVRGIAGYTHWMSTGFRRPQPPKQEGQ